MSEGKPKRKVFRAPKKSEPEVLADIAEANAEVDQLLGGDDPPSAVHPRVGKFSKLLVEEDDLGPAEASDIHPNSPRPGWVLDGRYQLEEIIGEGGMAVVWRAQHLRLEQSVAIKFLLRQGDEELRERFLREAKVAAAIQHRHVVQILDFGMSGDMAFMVMEHLVGLTLADRLTKEAVPAQEALRLTAEILGGLSAVHDAGMAHRDIKPENIFLVEDANGVYSKIVDFGLSKRIGANREKKLRSVIPTSENLITGTPEYMSPEQARGMPDIDERTDIWSVGVMLYEMLTGDFPHSAEVVGDLLFKIVAEDVPRLMDSRPDLGAHVDRFLAGALLRDRDKRYPDARSMRQALLVAVNKTSAQLYEAGKRSEAKLLLRSVSSAYEPGDSGMVFAPVFELDFSDVSETAARFENPQQSARQKRKTHGRPIVSDEIAIDIELDSMQSPPMVAPPAAPSVGAALPPRPSQADRESRPERESIPERESMPQRDSVDASRETPVASVPRRGGGLARVIGGLFLMVAGAAIGAIFLADTAQPVREVAQRAGVPGLAAEPQTFVPEQADPTPEPEVEEAPAPDPNASLTFEPIPERARIYVDGEPSENPVVLPKDGEEHLIVIRRPGFRAWSRRIVAEEDTTIEVRWVRARRGRMRGMTGLFKNSGI